MPRWAPILFALTLVCAPAAAQAKKDAKGRCKYRSSTVEIDGKSYRYSTLKSLTDTSPDAKALAAEHGRRLAEAKTAHALIKLGAWCVENGLGTESRAAYAKAVELDGENADARRGAGYVKTAEGWKPAADMYAAKFAKLNKKDTRAIVTLSDWCRKRALWTRAHDLLVMALSINGYDKKAAPRMDAWMKRRSSTIVFSPPFEGRWIAYPDKTRHHKTKSWALYAIDFLKVDENNKRFAGKNLRRLDKWYTYGAPVYAAADGVVTQADDGYPDLPIGKLGAAKKNNEVTLRHANGEYTVYAHMKNGSITVKKGQTVKRGQKLGEGGNSGKSNFPHLHFALMIPARESQTGRSAWVSAPFHFRGFKLVRVGNTKVDVAVEVGAPQEGWVMICPKPGGAKEKTD